MLFGTPKLLGAWFFCMRESAMAMPLLLPHVDKGGRKMSAKWAVWRVPSRSPEAGNACLPEPGRGCSLSPTLPFRFCRTATSLLEHLIRQALQLASDSVEIAEMLQQMQLQLASDSMETAEMLQAIAQQISNPWPISNTLPAEVRSNPSCPIYS